MIREPRRVRWIVAIATAALAGCQKADPSAAPEHALGDQPGALMPVQPPPADLSPLLGQESVQLTKKIEITYGPLRRRAEKPAEKPGDETIAVDDDEGEGAAAAAKKSPARSADAGKPKKRTRLGAALSGTVGLLGGGPKGGSPALRSASGGAGKIALVDASGEPAEIPDPPKEISAQQLQAVEAAARADAIRNLMRAAYQLPLEDGRTVGAAIEEDPDEYPTEPKGVIIIAAEWVDDETLQVEVEITVERLIESLSAAFGNVSFDALNKLGEGKALTAKGSAKVEGGGAGGAAKPARPPRRAGGGLS